MSAIRLRHCLVYNFQSIVEPIVCNISVQNIQTEFLKRLTSTNIQAAREIDPKAPDKASCRLRSEELVKNVFAAAIVSEIMYNNSSRSFQDIPGSETKISIACKIVDDADVGVDVLVKPLSWRVDVIVSRLAPTFIYIIFFIFLYF